MRWDAPVERSGESQERGCVLMMRERSYGGGARSDSRERDGTRRLRDRAVEKKDRACAGDILGKFCCPLLLDDYANAAGGRGFSQGFDQMPRGPVISTEKISAGKNEAAAPGAAWHSNPIIEPAGEAAHDPARAVQWPTASGRRRGWNS